MDAERQASFSGDDPVGQSIWRVISEGSEVPVMVLVTREEVVVLVVVDIVVLLACPEDDLEFELVGTTVLVTIMVVFETATTEATSDKGSESGRKKGRRIPFALAPGPLLSSSTVLVDFVD